MLKAYAVALILTTATPVVAKSVEGANLPEIVKVPTTQTWKPGSVVKD